MLLLLLISDINVSLPQNQHPHSDSVPFKLFSSTVSGLDTKLFPGLAHRQVLQLIYLLENISTCPNVDDLVKITGTMAEQNMKFDNRQQTLKYSLDE